MALGYDIDKIKFGTDPNTFDRAVLLYESGKVTNVQDQGREIIAVVQGGQLYRVVVEKSHFDKGDCECYLGQHDQLCKHLVALAIYVVQKGSPLTDADKKQPGEMQCSCRTGDLSKTELATVKKEISTALHNIKSYNGPSRIWFAYQGSLMEGVRRIAAIFSKLPVSEQTATFVVQTLMRMERKLMNGVDDSDGTVGGCMTEAVALLEEYARHDRACVKAFRRLCGLHTSFGWEEPLVRIDDEGVDGENVQ